MGENVATKTSICLVGRCLGMRTLLGTIATAPHAPAARQLRGAHEERGAFAAQRCTYMWERTRPRGLSIAGSFSPPKSPGSPGQAVPARVCRLFQKKVIFRKWRGLPSVDKRRRSRVWVKEVSHGRHRCGGGPGTMPCSGSGAGGPAQQPRPALWDPAITEPGGPAPPASALRALCAPHPFGRKRCG